MQIVVVIVLGSLAVISTVLVHLTKKSR